MTFTGITLLFVLGASAFEVPHWVQQKSVSFNAAPSLQKIMAPFRSLQSKMQTPNSRRLQAIMSEECKTACPTVEAYMKAMGELSENTPPADQEKAMTKLNCDNAEALGCATTESACQDKKEEEEEEASAEDEKEAMDAFKCSCKCANELAMMQDNQKMCDNKAKVIKCLTGESACASMVKQVGGTRMTDITCEKLNQKCDAKGNELQSCVTKANGDDATVAGEKMQTFGEECSKAAEDGDLEAKKDSCCSILTEVMGCYTVSCVKLDWEQQQIMLDVMKTKTEEEKDAKEEMKKKVNGNYQWGSVCSDAGLPSSKEALMPKPQGSTDFATSQAFPVLGMAAMLIAASF